MKRVYKYPFSLSSQKLELLMPVGFKFLRVELQNDVPCLWAEVFPDNSKETVRFSVFGTGQDIPPNSDYQGTFNVGPLVMHLYRI